MGRVGGIGHVGEWSASRHVQGGLGGRGNEYSGHVVTIALCVECVKGLGFNEGTSCSERGVLELKHATCYTS